MRESQIKRAHAAMDLLVIGAAVRPSTHATQWHAAQLIESIRGKAKRLARRRVNSCNEPRYCTDNYQRGTERLEKEIRREVEFLRLRAPGIVGFELSGALRDCVALKVETHTEGGAAFTRTVWL
jgi:hypothetical protein